MQGITHTTGWLIEKSLCDGVNCTHSTYAANLLYKSELIKFDNVHSTQCMVLHIQPDD